MSVLLADQRLAEGRARSRLLEQSATADIERLQQLGMTVTKAIEGSAALAPGPSFPYQQRGRRPP